MNASKWERGQAISTIPLPNLKFTIRNYYFVVGGIIHTVYNYFILSLFSLLFHILDYVNNIVLNTFNFKEELDAHIAHCTRLFSY